MNSGESTPDNVHLMEGQSATEFYIPQLPDSVKPKIGQEFDTIDDAYAFYNAYAKKAGFSTRNDSTKKRKGTNELCWKQYVCNKEGVSDLKSVERNRTILRVGCKAKLSVVNRKSSTKWVVSVFVEEHNHILVTPRKVHLLRSHREVSAPRKALFRQLAEANVPTNQQLRIMEIQSDGIEHVGCIERDLRNYERDIREEMKGHDAETLFEFFSLEKEKNSEFFFEFEKDGEDRMVHCFWADPISRRSYTYFGDVVVFDTTYKTNKYGMVFAPLTGVNHHDQTVLFGCGFLSNERAESFEWLFDKWLKAMVRGPPQVIITDQDPAITRAIANKLKNTSHHFCIWHIMFKFSEKIGPIKSRGYLKYFQRSVYESDTREEFEASWMHVLEKSSLGDHDWLTTMFNIREKWVPAYTKSKFCAGMTSSQRAESIHRFFKRHVLSKHSLMDFITRFNRALVLQRQQELVAEHADINEQLPLKARMPMEKQMVKVYTKKKFLTFQEELLESNSYVAKLIREDAKESVYDIENVEPNSCKAKHLVFDSSSCIAKCSCMFFDFGGIPCKHILAFLRERHVIYLPDQYIMPRWTRSSKVGRYQGTDGVGVSYDTDNLLVTRHIKLSQLCSVAIDHASLLEEGAKILENAVEIAIEKLKDLNKSQGVGEASSTRKRNPENQVLNDPPQVAFKGCGKRLKSSKEKALGKRRLCHGCGKRGVNHDKRNCDLNKIREKVTVGDEFSHESQYSEDTQLTGADMISQLDEDITSP